MLTPDQKVVVFRDLIVLNLSERGSIGAVLLSRTRDGLYKGIYDLNEVASFYAEVTDVLVRVCSNIIEAIEGEVQTFKDELINLEVKEDDNERT